MRLFHIGARPAARAPWSSEPDWMQANPARIRRALDRALARPSGGWYALGASRAIGDGPEKMLVDDRELVVWRAGGRIHVAPAACPHMGADLAAGSVRDGKLVCPWHGLALDAGGHGRWRCFPVHDDGVLVWARLDGGHTTEAPILAPRPSRFLDGVIDMEAKCDPEDVIANRLDPWHGVHYHAHSFAALEVVEADDDRIVLRVSFRVLGPVCVEVLASFHSPEPRTITMTILEGEGRDSVVETHATPVSKGRTRVIEATLATSERLGFRAIRRLGAVARPFVERRASRLWVEDVAYAERRYALRDRRREDESSAIRSLSRTRAH
jgi:isorenieratene synthase